MNKKYYSISEVAKILHVSTYQLRYLEKTSLKITINKVRNRRYYTSSDIEKFKFYLANTSRSNLTDRAPMSLQANEIRLKSADNSSNFIFSPDQLKQIDNLIHQFQSLSLTINKLLN